MTTNEEAAIRRVIEAWADALRRKDVDGVLAHYAPDAVSFDLAPPLRHRREEMKHGFAEWFPTWNGPIGYEIRDLTITAGGAVAFAHSLNHLTGSRTDGTESDVWLRATVCLVQRDGAWKVAHEHASVPFYMDGSYRAAVDLKP